jgi:hypothetical protein
MEIYLGFRYLFNKKDLQTPNGAYKRPFYLYVAVEKQMPTKAQCLLLVMAQNRINTRNMLRRKNMTLESYSCENCIWQKEETLYHL